MSNPSSENADAKNSTCSHCGTAFHCGITDGNHACWCFQLPQVAPMPTENNAAPGCLCPACLRRWIATQLSENKA